MTAKMPVVTSRILLVLLCALPLAANAQNANEPGPIRSSAAYAEVLLRRTEIQADLESMLADYTESNPRVIDARFEMASLDRSLERIFAVKASETGKLTLALGKLIVKRAALETEANRLARSYNADHPELRRARRRVEIFDAAVKEVLK